MKKLAQFGLAALGLILAIVLLFLPEKDNSKKLLPENILLEINDNTRVVTTDMLADWIINEDPILLVIDVRSKEAYDKFSIPGAINMPLEKLLEKDNKTYLALADMKKVFFSNDDLHANEAWMAAKRMGYENIYYMQGGLNKWVETILQPEKPLATALPEDFDLFNLRKAMSLYFIGGSGELEPETYDQALQQVAKAKTKKATPKKAIVPVPKKVQAAEEEEGC